MSRYGYFSSRGRYGSNTFNSTGGYYNETSVTFDFNYTRTSPRHVYVGNVNKS